MSQRGRGREEECPFYRNVRVRSILVMYAQYVLCTDGDAQAQEEYSDMLFHEAILLFAILFLPFFVSLVDTKSLFLANLFDA